MTVKPDLQLSQLYAEACAIAATHEALAVVSI